MNLKHLANFNQLSVSFIIGCSPQEIFYLNFEYIRCFFPEVILSTDNPEKDLLYYLNTKYPLLDEVVVKLVGDCGYATANVIFNRWGIVTMTPFVIKSVELTCGLPLVVVQHVQLLTNTYEAIQTKRIENFTYLIGKVIKGVERESISVITDVKDYICSQNLSDEDLGIVTNWLTLNGICVDIEI